MFVEDFNAFGGESVVGDEKLLQEKVVKEHLFETLICQMVINEIKDAETLVEEFGDVGLD